MLFTPKNIAQYIFRVFMIKSTFMLHTAVLHVAPMYPIMKQYRLSGFLLFFLKLIFFLRS